MGVDQHSAPILYFSKKQLTIDKLPESVQFQELSDRHSFFENEF